MGIAFAVSMIALAVWNAAYCVAKIIEDRKAQRSTAMALGLVALIGVIAPLTVLAVISVRGR